jgi:phosphatidylglycerol---prolipoprotein diacylglyceryl transferase
MKTEKKNGFAMKILAGALGAFFLWLIFGFRVFSDWSHLPYRIDPVAFGIGPIQVHWYGIMYVAALLTSYGLVIYRLRTESWPVTETTMSDFLNWAVLGVLLGGRLGYVLFYKPMYFLTHPLAIISPLQFDGQRWTFGIYGMSYHGGLLGMIIVVVLFCRKINIPVFQFADLITPAVPLGYAFGRLGNFINGELYGRVTNVPWGMLFPLDETRRLRHPSQLYEMFFEGIFLFVLLWPVRNKSWARGRLFGFYLIGYGAVRFCLEFFREPDPFLGYLAGGLTMGQWLCIAMVLSGILFSSKKLFDKKSN